MHKRWFIDPWATCVVPQNQCTAAANVNILIVEEESYLLRQAMGVGEIRGVHPGQIKAPRPVDALIQTGCEAEPSSVMQADYSRILKAFCDRKTIIVTVIVAQQEFKVVVALL